MWIIQVDPAEARKAVCTKCGKRAAQAGYTVADVTVDAVLDRPPSSRVLSKKDVSPLCAACVTALLRSAEFVVDSGEGGDRWA